MGVCFQWRDTHTCKFGEACRFSHDGQPPSSSFSSFGGQRGVCRNYRDTGECKFGELCKYSHDVPKEDGKLQQLMGTSGSTITTSLVSNTAGILSPSSNSTITTGTSGSLSIQGVSIQFNSGPTLSQQLGSQSLQSSQAGLSSLSTLSNLSSGSHQPSNGEYFDDGGNVDADDENA
jgi:hypothetical protein